MLPRLFFITAPFYNSGLFELTQENGGSLWQGGLNFLSLSFHIGPGPVNTVTETLQADQLCHSIPGLQSPRVRGIRPAPEASEHPGRY